MKALRAGHHSLTIGHAVMIPVMAAIDPAIPAAIVQRRIVRNRLSSRSAAARSFLFSQVSTNDREGYGAWSPIDDSGASDEWSMRPNLSLMRAGPNSSSIASQ